MEDIDIINLWKSQNAKLEESLEINKKLLRETINQKAQSTLKKLIIQKQIGIIATIMYLLFLTIALFYVFQNYSSAWNYFVVSVVIIIIINVKGLADYMRHIYMVNQINYYGNIIKIQEQLLQLQLSVINHAKIMCLQFPFYTTFYLSNRWFPQDVGWGYLTFQIVLTSVLTYLSYWLYQNHKIENLHKKWFKEMIAFSGGKNIINAIKFYQEIEQYKSDTA